MGIEALKETEPIKGNLRKTVENHLYDIKKESDHLPLSGKSIVQMEQEIVINTMKIEQSIKFITNS